jgi:hypothetical protein
MENRRTTRITVTTEEVWALRRPTLIAEGWCEKCAADVRMAPAEKVAGMLGISARAIYRSVENERLHYRETPDGRLFICLPSIHTNCQTVLPARAVYD